MSARFQYSRISEKQDYIVCSAISHSASRCVSPSSRTRSATKSCDLSKKAYSTLASRSRDPNPKIRFLLMCSEKATAVSLSKRRSSTQEPEKKVPIINSASPTLVASAHQQISKVLDAMESQSLQKLWTTTFENKFSGTAGLSIRNPMPMRSRRISIYLI